MSHKEPLLTNKDFTLFARLAIAAVIAIVCAAAKMSGSTKLILCIAAIIIAAFELLTRVAKNILKFNFLNEQFLILIALIVTLIAGKYPEAVLAAMLYRVSEFLSQKLRRHALDMAESAGCYPDTDKRSRMDAFVTKTLHYYVPAVILIALLVAFIPMIFVEDIIPWLTRAAIILMVGSPCAITFSIPLCSLFAIYRMSHEGLALNSAAATDMLAAVNTVVFDNTEALSASKYILSDILPVPGLSSRNLLMLAAYAAASAGHPSADILSSASGENIDFDHITGKEQIAGLGVLAHVKGLVISAGNLAMMDKLGMRTAAEALSSDSNALHVALNGSYAGCIVINRMTNESAKRAIESLSNIGISRIVLLSSASTKSTARTAKSLGITEYFSECSSEEKAKQLEKLIAETFPEESLCYMGSESALLEAADIGIAEGESVPGCDAVLTTDDIGSLADAVVTAKRGRSIIIQGLVLAIVLKIALLILTIIGIAPFWAAILADTGVAILTVANAMRAGR